MSENIPISPTWKILIRKWKYDNTIPSVVMQNEVQELGGEYSKHPVSAFFRLLMEVLDLDPKETTILDLTYGVGDFYRFYRPKYLVDVDIKKWDWVVEPDCFYQMEFWKIVDQLNEKFSVVVFDPPYNVSTSSSLLSEERPYLYYGKENLLIMMKYFPKIALRYVTKYIIVKFMDSKDITVFDLVKEMKKSPTYIIVYRYIRANRPRTNIKILKTHTYWLIWEVK